MVQRENTEMQVFVAAGYMDDMGYVVLEEICQMDWKLRGDRVIEDTSLRNRAAASEDVLQLLDNGLAHNTVLAHSTLGSIFDTTTVASMHNLEDD